MSNFVSSFSYQLQLKSTSTLESSISTMKRPSLHAKLFHNGQHKSIRAVKSQAAINEVPNRSPNWSPTSLRRLKAKLSRLSFSSSDPDKLENSLQTYLVQAPEQPSQDTLDSLSPLGTFSPRRSKFSYSPVDSYFSVTCDSAPEFLYHFRKCFYSQFTWHCLTLLI